MSKKLSYRTYRVVVEPADPWIFSKRTPESLANDRKNECERICEEIKRHVDGVQNINIEVGDESFQCEFCGSPWTEAGDFNLCCDGDMENMPPEEASTENP